MSIETSNLVEVDRSVEREIRLAQSIADTVIKLTGIQLGPEYYTGESANLSQIETAHYEYTGTPDLFTPQGLHAEFVAGETWDAFKFATDTLGAGTCVEATLFYEEDEDYDFVFDETQKPVVESVEIAIADYDVHMNMQDLTNINDLSDPEYEVIVKILENTVTAVPDMMSTYRRME